MENYQKVKNAAKWSFAGEIITKTVSPITSMILARVLTPEAFGVVATVMMIVSFADLFTDAGFQKYIIQHHFECRDDEELSICTAFWMNLSISLIFWLMIYLRCDRIAELVGNPGLGKVIYIGALLLPMTAFSSIQMAIYKRRFEFKILAIVRVIVKLIPLIITVPLAIRGLSYWALIVGSLSSELINAIILTFFSEWKPKLKFSFLKLKEMFKFCGWALLEVFSAWMISNIGIFIIGNVFNDYYLGIYKISITMATQITSVISGAVISVMFSTLSKLQNNEKEFKKIYFEFLNIVGIIAIPLGAGVFLYRDIARLVLLGAQWKKADLLLGLWGMILIESVLIGDMSGIIILSKGKPKYLFVSNLIQIMLMVPVMFKSAQYGFDVFVKCICLVRLQLPVTNLVFASKISGIKVLSVIKELKYYIIATAVMTMSSFGMTGIFRGSIFRYISIIICIIIYFVILCLHPISRRKIKKYIRKLLLNK